MTKEAVDAFSLPKLPEKSATICSDATAVGPDRDPARPTIVDALSDGGAPARSISPRSRFGGSEDHPGMNRRKFVWLLIVDTGGGLTTHLSTPLWCGTTGLGTATSANMSE
jgi:hypothetical protein